MAFVSDFDDLGHRNDRLDRALGLDALQSALTAHRLPGYATGYFDGYSLRAAPVGDHQRGPRSLTTNRAVGDRSGGTATAIALDRGGRQVTPDSFDEDAALRQADILTGPFRDS